MARGGKRQGAGRKRADSAVLLEAGWYVYVLKEDADNDFRKVGVASNPLSRLSSHQVSNPRQLRFEGLWKLDGSDAYLAVEKAVHRSLVPFHVRGEWFEAPKDKVAKTIEEVCGAMLLKVERIA